MHPQQPHDMARAHAHSQRSIGLYRVAYLLTGLAFAAAACVVVYLNDHFKSDAILINEQIMHANQLQVESQRVKAIGTEYWLPNTSKAYLDGQLVDSRSRIDRILLRLQATTTSDGKPQDYFGSGMDRALTRFRSAWDDTAFALEQMRENDAAVVLQKVQLTSQEMVQHASDLLRETMAAQSKNQLNRSWLMGILLAGLGGLALLMLWFLWSATQSRMEITSLNMMLERRVEERTAELEKANLYLANVQSSIASALIVTNPQNRVITWNAAAEQLFRVPKEMAQGKDIVSLPQITLIASFSAALQRAQANCETVRLKAVSLDSRKDRNRYGNISFVPLLGPLAEGLGVVILIDDISDMVYAQGQLVERATEIDHTNKQLKRVNNDLEQFVYAASHDLKAPLVNMHGLTERIYTVCDKASDSIEASNADASDAVESAIQHEIPKMIDRLQTSISKCASIIDGLLRFSRTGREEYNTIDLDMNQEVSSVVDLFASTLEDKDVQIFVADLPTVHADKEAVNKIMSNLLGNALNYLDPQRAGEIVIEGETLDDNTCKFYVKDNGIGIKEVNLDRVFKIFERIDSSHSQGEGLGLAIVKKIVESHGGEIAVESTWGEGTTFWFTLPVAQSSEVAVVGEGC